MTLNQTQEKTYANDTYSKMIIFFEAGWLNYVIPLFTTPRRKADGTIPESQKNNLGWKIYPDRPHGSTMGEYWSDSNFIYANDGFWRDDKKGKSVFDGQKYKLNRKTLDLHSTTHASMYGTYDQPLINTWNCKISTIDEAYNFLQKKVDALNEAWKKSREGNKI